MAQELLTVGSVQQIYNGTQANQPVLQVVDIKRLQPASSSQITERYRLVVSDSQYYIQAMLTTQLNSLVTNKSIENFGLIRLNEYMCNQVHSNKIVIILKCENVSGPTDGAIGTPANIERAQGQTGGQMQMDDSNDSLPPGPDGQTVYPISCLNNFQNNWMIRGKIVYKGAIREFTAKSGKHCRIMNLDIADKSGEIRLNLWEPECDTLGSIFQKDGVYCVSGGKLRMAYKRSKHEYEITLNSKSTVTADTSVNPAELTSTQNYTFVPIEGVQNINEGEFCDVIGIIKTVSDVDTITSKKSGQEFSKRAITLVDQTSRAIDLTIWRDAAENFEGQVGYVMVVKEAKVSDFNGKTLGTIGSTRIEFNPNIPEAATLRQWWDSSDATQLEASIVTLSQRSGGFSGGSSNRNTEEKPLSAVDAEGLGVGKADYFKVRGMVTKIKHGDNAKLCYDACPSEKCNKKVEESNGQFYCSGCGKQYNTCEKRYVLSLLCSDHTGHKWLGCFDREGNQILGLPADQVEGYKESQSAGTMPESEYNHIFERATLKPVELVLRAREEEYKGEQIVKCNLIGYKELDFVEEGNTLLAKIASYM